MGINSDFSNRLQFDSNCRRGTPMLAGAAEEFQPHVAFGRGGAAREHEALGKLGFSLGDGQAAESEQFRAGAAAAVLALEAPRLHT
jgi:hypothetical protein